MPTYSLGALYDNGHGVDKDLMKACKYYIKAFKLGHAGGFSQITKMTHMTLINLFDYQTNKLQMVIDLKDQQIEELKLRPPELGGPEYESAKAHFQQSGICKI